MKEEIKLAEVLNRELDGKNISEIAKSLGLNPSLLHDWKTQNRIPSARNLPHLRKLARYLGLTLEQILFDESNSGFVTITSTVFNDGGTQYRVAVEKIKS